MIDSYRSAGQQVHATALSLLELTAGVLQTDAASLWCYDTSEAHLVARFPDARAPTVRFFSTMPEIAASIRAEETRLYVRDDVSGAVREWMDQAGIAVSLRLPVSAPQVPRHFLGLSWVTADHPPVATLLPTARRFADHIALALARSTERVQRVESALELADNVAQALVLAKSWMHLDRPQDAERAIDRALDETQRIMKRLIRVDQTDNLRRLHPSDVMGTADT